MFAGGSVAIICSLISSERMIFSTLWNVFLVADPFRLHDVHGT